MRKLAALVTDDSGQDLIEYAMLAALMGLASVAAIQPVASKLSNTFAAVDNALHSDCPPGVSCRSGH